MSIFKQHKYNVKEEKQNITLFTQCDSYYVFKKSVKINDVFSRNRKKPTLKFI